MHSLQLEFTTKGTINVFVSTTYIYNTVFSSTCVFKIYKPSISISITRNRYRNDHFRKFLLFQLWQYSNAFSNCSFERTNNRSQREIKGEMKSLVPTFQSEKEEREVHNRPKYEKIQLNLAQLDST